MIKLGLIGDNIKTSRAPKLHRLCGEMCGIDVSYDLLIPKDQGLDFDALFARCQAEGYRGLNITLPYKIKVVPKVSICDPLLQKLGAVNTVVFSTDGAQGFNTDYTGFVAAYRGRFGEEKPGCVALAGAGGVGRAVAFGLLALGADEIRIHDQDARLASALAQDVGVGVVCDTIGVAVLGADGLANCTPLGMEGYGGTAFPAELVHGQTWAFDAVYQPLETQFLKAAKAAGMRILDGYELHFYQGILAFQHFTECMPHDLALLRRQHLSPDP
jgi:shikimate dehydrogenase